MDSWVEQLKRTRRYYERFKSLTEGAVPPMSLECHLDDVLAFFQNCHHLKDHLKNDDTYDAHEDEEIEQHINATPALALCADLCNGSKHLKMNRSPRSGAHPQFGGKVFSATIGGESSVMAVSLQIDHAGQCLDAFDVATDALSAWESFLNTR